MTRSEVFATRPKALMIVSAFAYAMSLMLPAFHADPGGDFPGFFALILGPIHLLSLQPIWLANPLLFISWWWLANGEPKPALAYAVLSLAAAFVFLLREGSHIVVGSSGPSTYVASTGYFVWLAAIAVQIVAAAGPALRSRAPFGRWPARTIAWSLLVGLGLVLALSARSFLAPTGRYMTIRAADELFAQGCRSAGEISPTSPIHAESLYFDRGSDQSHNFGVVNRGVFSHYGSGMLSNALLGSGFLSHYEKALDPEYANAPPRYRRFTLHEKNGVPVEAISSEYGVFRRSLVGDHLRNTLDVDGAEVTIRNLKTGETVASLTYFVNTHRRTVCGHPRDGANFDVTEFVRRSLNLERKFPAYPSPHSKPS